MIHAQFTMRSVALEMDTKVDILLPEDRHHTVNTRGKTYPVLYILHGMKNDNSSWMNLSNIFLTCRDMDLIVVMPSVQKSFYTDMVYGLDYYTYVSEELPLKLKNYLPITDDPQQTFIMGESMGGYGTLRIALSKPEQYGKAVCLSGFNIGWASALPEKARIGAFGFPETIDASDNNLLNLVERLKQHPGPLPAFKFYCGTEDICYPGCHSFYTTLKESCPKMQVEGEFWHGQHNFFFWNQAIPKALKWMGFDIVEDEVI